MWTTSGTFCTFTTGFIRQLDCWKQKYTRNIHAHQLWLNQFETLYATIAYPAFKQLISTKAIKLNQSANLFEQEIDFMHHYAFPALKSYSMTHFPSMSSYLQRNLFNFWTGNRFHIPTRMPSFKIFSITYLHACLHFSNEIYLCTDVYLRVFQMIIQSIINFRSVVDVLYRVCFNELRRHSTRNHQHICHINYAQDHCFNRYFNR